MKKSYAHLHSPCGNATSVLSFSRLGTKGKALAKTEILAELIISVLANTN